MCYTVRVKNQGGKPSRSPASLRCDSSKPSFKVCDYSSLPSLRLQTSIRWQESDGRGVVVLSMLLSGTSEREMEWS
jgi:hypothetical protein